MATKKSMYNLIYKLRKAGKGRIDTKGRMIYYYYLSPEMILSKQHDRLVKEFGFLKQSEWVKQ